MKEWKLGFILVLCGWKQKQLWLGVIIIRHFQKNTPFRDLLNNFDHDPCFFKKLIGFRMFDRLILRIFLLFNKPPNSLDIEIIFDFLFYLKVVKLAHFEWWSLKHTFDWNRLTKLRIRAKSLDPLNNCRLKVLSLTWFITWVDEVALGTAHLILEEGQQSVWLGRYLGWGRRVWIPRFGFFFSA